ncbi:hypothetical protein [Nitrobacter vulgaris]|uniref:hypothetical protein n=1 Tax=Nitrobacter vulgaris TaxID=29421 RepID=UPI00286B1BE1|nr:hypothetical protein [Nitrobacter vulgaris]
MVEEDPEWLSEAIKTPPKVLLNAGSKVTIPSSNVRAMQTLVAILSFSFLGTVVTTAVLIGIARRLRPRHLRDIGDFDE